MFDKPKTSAMNLPKDAKVSWVVRYHKGRKPFDDERLARRFMAECRAEEKGWSELVQQIEIVKVKRK